MAPRLAGFASYRSRKFQAFRPLFDQLEDRLLLTELADFVAFSNTHVVLEKNVNVLHGMIGTAQAFPKVQLPLATDITTNPANDISTRKNTTKAVPPGKYGDVVLGADSTLKLSHGEYFFDRISAARNLSLKLNLSEGEISIFVVGNVTFDRNLRVKLISGAADKVFFETHGAFTLHKDGRCARIF